MKTGKKLLTGSLLALCAVLLVLCIVLAIGWSKAAKTDTALPEVRNNGTAIQWKYSDETDWRDLVALTELRGAAGENGKDGANGKDGINGKSIEVQRATEYIQWHYEGDEWQNLVAIADITGPTGQNGKDGANGKTPEFRVNENTLQWRYVGDEIWLNLYDLTALKGADGRDGVDGKDGINGQDGRDGADGTNGQNGSDGKDGNTPFIGENGNWWIGETDTAVKAAGIDGADGVDGERVIRATKVTPAKREIREIRGTKATRATPVRTAEAPGIFTARGMYRQPIFQTVQFPCTIGKCITAAGLYRTTEQHSG